MNKPLSAKLYHATFPENADKICAEGIKPGIDGLVYMCESVDSTIPFLALRGADRLTVIEITTAALDINKIDIGMDHSPAFFGDIKVWTYPEVIPPSAFVCNDVYEVAR
jgi:hypothetical protein